VAIKEPETRKPYPLQSSSYRGPRRLKPPGRRKHTPSTTLAFKRHATQFLARLSLIGRQRRQARILDALAVDAVREYNAGRTRNLRDFAREHNIAVDDQ